jgi:DNA-binding transcriptional ArsR family regulator
VTDRSAPVFEALADPTRRAVLRTLASAGPSTLAELSRELPVSRQAIAKHLALLREAGLVSASGQVRGRRYELRPRPLEDAVGWIAEVGGDWDARLARLKRDVEAGRRHR